MSVADDIRVGDLVNVPGAMYGTVRFLGTVAGKPGRFAGVELAPEHAGKGKNSGDVEGRQYFNTGVPGSGIFVPINSSRYVTKRAPVTPPTSTPARPNVPNFSRSVGPGAMPSVVPTSASRPKFRRPSLPRPESPRAPQQPLPPPPQTTTKLNLGGLRTPSSFSKSTNTANGLPRTPLKSVRPPSRPPSRVSMEDSRTPTPAMRRAEGVRTPAFDEQDNTSERIRNLEKQLRDRDKQLEEQASALTELQKSITELEGADALQIRSQLREKNEKIAALTAEFDSHRADFRSTLDTLEVAASETERVYEKRIEELLQANRELQERNEDVEAVARQLKQLEELVSELEEGLEDARRGEAEARGEVEFLRGEVERTKLELKQERDKSAPTALVKDVDGGGRGAATLRAEVDQKNDEIRGLKAIIHSLSRGDPTTNSSGPQENGAGKRTSAGQNEPERISRLERRIQELESLSERKSYRIEELERDLGRNRPNDRTPTRNRSSTITTAPLKLQRKNSQSTAVAAATANNITPNHSHSLSDRTIVPNDYSDRNTNGGAYSVHTASSRGTNSGRPSDSRQLAAMHESDGQSTSTDEGSALWCEICETSGHDILTCTNMFGAGAGIVVNNGGPAVPPKDAPRVTTTPSNNSNNNNNAGVHATGGVNATNTLQQQTSYGGNASNGLKNITTPSNSQRTGRDAVLEGLKGLGGLSSTMSPTAGKASGVIDESKWCALCERDGHESIDCPFDE